MNKSLLFLMPFLVLPLIGCGENFDGTTVQFWGWGEEGEIAIFKNIVKTYNKQNTDHIRVQFAYQPSTGYEEKLTNTLRAKNAPDIFFVGDKQIKNYAEQRWIEPLTDYLSQSTKIDLSKMWKAGINRYRYNVETKTSTEQDTIYCLPKDLGPSVIFYNKKAFEKAGVTCISKELKDCSEEYEKHGFYQPGGEDYSKPAYFNNKISMTVEEELALSKRLTKSKNPNSITDYGFYTEWWYNYVWSMGGDVINVQDDGYYHWTLGDKTLTDYVYNGNPISTYDAFKHFVDLSTVEKVMPKPNEVSSKDKIGLFAIGKMAMCVGIRPNVSDLRNLNTKFEWDVAPLSHYQNAVPGKEIGSIGHSGSMGYGIARESSQEKKDAAFKFMEYMAGEQGQRDLAESGFCVGNQKELAQEIVSKETQPKNAPIFVDYIEKQRGGDWTMLSDSNWIDTLWAGTLNGSVLSGDMSLDTFFATYQDRTDAMLKHYGHFGD